MEPPARSCTATLDAFVPYLMANPIDVSTLSIEEIRKRALPLHSSSQYEVILQNLLLVAQEINQTNRPRGRQLESLAIELFLEASFVIQCDFLTQIRKVDCVAKQFIRAFKISYSEHALQEMEKPGSSGFTSHQLNMEKGYVTTLPNYF